MPQWDFLDFLAGQARAWPGFRLLMQTEGQSLVEADGRIVGVRAAGPDGAVEIGADLVLCADGRRSAMRAQAGLVPRDFAAPIDVPWFRRRGDEWQCAAVVPKGGDPSPRPRRLAPALSEGGAPQYPPLALRLLDRLPWLQRIPARFVGLGFRPEHPLPAERPQARL